MDGDSQSLSVRVCACSRSLVVMRCERATQLVMCGVTLFMAQRRDMAHQVHGAHTERHSTRAPSSGGVAPAPRPASHDAAAGQPSAARRRPRRGGAPLRARGGGRGGAPARLRGREGLTASNAARATTGGPCRLGVSARRRGGGGAGCRAQHCDGTGGRNCARRAAAGREHPPACIHARANARTTHEHAETQGGARAHAHNRTKGTHIARRSRAGLLETTRGSPSRPPRTAAGQRASAAAAALPTRSPQRRPCHPRARARAGRARAPRLRPRRAARCIEARDRAAWAPI